MATEQMYEGEKRAFPYTMTFGTHWSGGQTAGAPIPKADVSRVIFSIRRKKDSVPFITLYDRDADGGTDTPSEIEWISTTLGTIRVKLSTQTQAKIAQGAIFQLRVNWTAGGFSILDTDTLDILDTLTV